MIGIVVGVNLISPVNNVVQTVTTPTYASSVVSLTGVLPIIFVTVIILGAIACLIISSAPSRSDSGRITCQMRGKLNWLVQHANRLAKQVLSGTGQCRETRWQGTLIRVQSSWYSPILLERGENSIIVCERDGLQGLKSYTNIHGKGVSKGEGSNSLPFFPSKELF